MIRFIALAQREPDLQSQGLPTLLTAMGRQIDMKAVHEALATRATANWSKPIYGSDEITRETLARAGRLVPMSPSNQARASNRLNRPNQEPMVPQKTEDACRGPSKKRPKWPSYWGLELSERT